MAEMAASSWSSDTSMNPKPLGRPDSLVGIVAPVPPHWEKALSRSASEVLKERFPTNSRLLIGPFDRSFTAVRPWSGATRAFLRLVRHHRWETGNALRIGFPGGAPQ